MKKNYVIIVLAIISSIANAQENWKKQEKVFHTPYPGILKYQNVRAERRNNNLAFTLPVCHFDTIYWYAGDSITHNWVLSEKYKLIYDSQNNLITEVYKTWNGSSWVNSQIYNYTYDANKNKTNETIQQWNGSSYDNLNQYNYTYDTNNNMTGTAYRQWNGSSWDNTHQYIYTYDANNNQTSEVEQQWNGNSWDNAYQRVYTYNANNNMTIELDKSWNISTWENSYQLIFTYDANNNRVAGLGEMWNSSVSSWNNSGQYTYAYDANNNQLSETDQRWTGTTWENFSQITNTYDVNNNMLTYSLKDWDVNIDSWANEWDAVFTYCSNKCQATESTRTWINNGWEKQDSVTTFCSFHNGIIESILDDSISIFPNPFSTQAVFHTDNLFNNAILTVYNSYGQQVKQIKNISGQTIVFHRDNLPSGLYFFYLTQDNRTVAADKLVITDN